MKDNIIKRITDAQAGRVKSLEGKFVYMPKEIYGRDESGNVSRTGYVCSYIAAARKYATGKINLSLVALDGGYDGSPIDADDERTWTHEILDISKICDLDIRDSFDDFKD
jgi:hypothetical protein